MLATTTERKLGDRLMAVAGTIVETTSTNIAERRQRQVLAAIANAEPVTLGEVARKLGRPLPAMSRSVDALVKAGLVRRVEASDDRRRLALSLTAEGRELLASVPDCGDRFAAQLGRLAHSELRAVERAVEILERGLR